MEGCSRRVVGFGSFELIRVVVLLCYGCVY